MGSNFELCLAQTLSFLRFPDTERYTRHSSVNDIPQVFKLSTAVTPRKTEVICGLIFGDFVSGMNRLQRSNLRYLWMLSLEHWRPGIVSLRANFLVLRPLLWRDLEITIFWTFLRMEGLPLLFSSTRDFWDNLFFHQPYTGLKIIFIAFAS